MSASINLKGSLEASGDGCSSSCGSGGGDRALKSLALRCSPSFYQGAVQTDLPVSVQTAGLPGAAFVDLPILEQLTAIELLYVKTTAPIVFRIGADVARMLGVGGTFALVGAETLNLEIDGVPVAVVFSAGDDTAAECAARINAAAALAGLPTPRVTVVGGQLQIESVLTGQDGDVEVVSGTGSALLGLTNGEIELGAGADVRIYGTGLWEFDPSPNAPTRVQVSGQGQITLLAAGRTSA